MFFQETTPDTSGYMIAGYVITFLVMALYVASIYLRRRNLKQDMTILEEMDKSAEPAPTDAPPSTKGRKNPSANKSAKAVTKKSMQN